jgi:hypothetical protein
MERLTIYLFTIRVILSVLAPCLEAEFRAHLILSTDSALLLVKPVVGVDKLIIDVVASMD